MPSWCGREQQLLFFTIAVSVFTFEDSRWLLRHESRLWGPQLRSEPHTIEYEMKALSLDLSCLEFWNLLKQELFCNSCYVICSRCVKWVVYEVENYPRVFVFYLQQFLYWVPFRDASVSDVSIAVTFAEFRRCPVISFKVFVFSIISPLNGPPYEHMLQYIDVNLSMVLNVFISLLL
jgi:hypothetical protein